MGATTDDLLRTQAIATVVIGTPCLAATSFDNGRGLCTFHNQVGENPGWHAEKIGDRIITTTPSGHTYESDDRNGTTTGRPLMQPEKRHAVSGKPGTATERPHQR